MNYEEKYKQALERATKLAFTGNISAIVAGEIFPELRESEDERIRKEIIQYLKDYPNLPNGNYCRNDFFAWLEKQGEKKDTVTPQWMVDFLKDHRRHFATPMGYDEKKETDGKLLAVIKWLEGNPQLEQKPSWSEEDEKIRKDLITYINSIKGDTLDLTMRASKWLCWLEKQKEQKQIIAVDSDQLLKILPRTVEWSEENEKIMKRIDSLLYSQCTIHGSEYESIHNWLKSLKPQKHWKPSEEQMDAVKYFIDFHRPQANASIEGWSEFEHLESLYNDLKKL